MKVAIIPARGGSRRIPRKNFREFHGRPILAYSVDAARASGLFDGGVWVSAEEQDWGEIGIAAPQAGWIRRYPEYARDEVGTQEVVRHALEVMQGERDRESAALGTTKPMPDYVCCIYATAPLMLPEDLISGFQKIGIRGNCYAKSVAPDGTDAGQWYWGTARAFIDGVPLVGNTTAYTLPWTRVCDINTEEDWRRAEALYAALHHRKATA